MDKIIVNGKVAVLISPSYGAGWSTWNKDYDCLFNPQIVTLVLEEKQSLITEELCKKIFGSGFYVMQDMDLSVEWVPQGTLFKISEYDGAESIEFKEDSDWLVA